MSDDIVKALLDSLTPEQKSQLIEGLLNTNVKSDDKRVKAEPTHTSKVKEDFTVSRNEELDQRKKVVKARKNSWSDVGEFRDEDVDYEKFEKTRTPRRRGKPKKREVECHVCGKMFSVNENMVFGEYMRCNRCTGR
tara:strand:+ start:7026 stop:7433 length:408 start_codon:yes stop_codon:yes gene_type:complete